jgi:hypothetical protein
MSMSKTESERKEKENLKTKPKTKQNKTNKPPNSPYQTIKRDFSLSPLMWFLLTVMLFFIAVNTMTNLLFAHTYSDVATNTTSTTTIIILLFLQMSLIIGGLMIIRTSCGIAFHMTKWGTLVIWAGGIVSSGLKHVPSWKETMIMIHHFHPQL